MKNDPLVSVVTTCYNSGKTIERTINSVLNQTYKHIEYIVIDAASTDDTQKIIDEYSNSIIYYESKEDNGIAEGWNRGINKSNGEYIQILNADDYLPKTKIQNSIECFKNNPNTGFVFGDLIMLNKENRMIYKIAGDPKYYNKIKYVMPRLNHPTVMVKKEVYDKFGLFDTNFEIGMDYEWLLRVTRNGESGIYISNIYTYMLEGGLSEGEQTKALMEERQIATLHGLNNKLSFFIYIFRLIKMAIRTTLEKFLPQKHLFLFRPGKEFFNN